METARSLELLNMNEVNTLAETMFADMPENEKGKEQDRLKDVIGKRAQAMAIVDDAKKKYKM